MYIAKITAAERVTIDNACGSFFNRVNMAQRLLMNVWDEHFGAYEQEAIDEQTARIIGDTIFLIWDNIFQGLLDYALTVGRDDFEGVAPYLDGAREAQTVIECRELSDEVFDIMNKQPWSEAKEKDFEERKQMMKLPNERAIAAFKKWLKEHERKEVR